MNKNKIALSLPVGLNKGDNKKRSREDLDQTQDQPDTYEDLLASLKLMIDEGNSRIESKIDSSNNKLVNEITTLRNDVQQLRAECTADVSQLSNTITKLDTVVKQNKNDIERFGKNNDLLLSGVPYDPMEKTSDIFRKVALAVGYCDSDVPLVYTKRLARIPVAIGSAPPILLQFAFKAARDSFLYRYLSQRNLSLQHIGFELNRRIYVNENRTETARRIRGSSVKLKKSGQIQAVFSRNGIVHIKLNADDVVQPVYGIEQLEDIAAKSKNPS